MYERARKIRRKRRRDDEQYPHAPLVQRAEQPAEREAYLEMQNTIGNQATAERADLRKRYHDWLSEIDTQMSADQQKNSDVFALLRLFLQQMPVIRTNSREWMVFLKLLESFAMPPNSAVIFSQYHSVETDLPGGIEMVLTVPEMYQRLHTLYLLQLTRTLYGDLLPEAVRQVLDGMIDNLRAAFEKLWIVVGVDDAIDDEELWHRPLFERIGLEPLWLLISDPDEKGDVHPVTERGEITQQPLPMSYEQVLIAMELYKGLRTQLLNQPTDTTPNTSPTSANSTRNRGS